MPYRITNSCHYLYNATLHDIDDPDVNMSSLYFLRVEITSGLPMHPQLRNVYRRIISRLETCEKKSSGGWSSGGECRKVLYIICKRIIHNCNKQTDYCLLNTYYLIFTHLCKCRLNKIYKTLITEDGWISVENVINILHILCKWYT